MNEATIIELGLSTLIKKLPFWSVIVLYLSLSSCEILAETKGWRLIASIILPVIDVCANELMEDRKMSKNNKYLYI